VQVVDKKVQLKLVGLDGNAFTLIGAFQRQARKEGWVKEEIDKVLTECQSSDYNHLLATLIDHCDSPEEKEDDSEEDDSDDEDYYDDDNESFN
jgi:hypothetical protein